MAGLFLVLLPALLLLDSATSAQTLPDTTPVQTGEGNAQTPPNHTQMPLNDAVSANPDAPGQTAPKVVATQTIRGVTVRIVDAYWRRAHIHTRTQGAVPFPKGLFVKFDVQTDPTLGFTLTPDEMDPHFVPDDLDKTDHGLTPPDILFSDRVDPRTDHVTLSFREKDPNAGPHDGGEADTPLVFRNISIPPEPNKELPVHITLPTPHGGSLTLVAVSLRTADKADRPLPETCFWFRAGGSASVKDLTVRPGEIILCHDSAYNRLSETDATPDKFRTFFANDPSGRFGVACFAWPVPSALSITLSINAIEQASSLRKNASFRTFSLDVPLPGLRGLAPGATWKPVAHAESRPLAGDVQSLMRDGDDYSLRAWVRDTTGPKQWEFGELALLNPDRSTFSSPPFGQAGVTRDPDQYFKPSGEAVQPGETGLVWNIPRSMIQKIGRQVGFRIIGQQTHDDVRHFQFRHLPVPLPGGSAEVNVDSVDPAGGHITVRLLAWVKAGLGHPNGPPELLVTCDCSPFAPNRETAYHDQKVTDDQGRPVPEVEGFGLDDQHYSFTVAPPAGVRFLNVSGKVWAVCKDGGPVTLTFPSITVGPPPRPVALPPPL